MLAELHRFVHDRALSIVQAEKAGVSGDDCDAAREIIVAACERETPAPNRPGEPAGAMLQANSLPPLEDAEGDAAEPQADQAAPSAKDAVRGRRLLFPLITWIILLAVSEFAAVLGAWRWGQGDNLWQKIDASWKFLTVPPVVCLVGFLLHSDEAGRRLLKRCKGED